MNFECTPSVLIVDDEPGLRVALRAHFERERWQVELAGGLREAINLLQRKHFDLVLCDMRMGDGDGFGVLEAVRSEAPETAFLFLTAYGSVPEAVRAMQGGAVDYLTKPISFEHLKSVLKRVLSGFEAKKSAPAAGPEEVSRPGTPTGGMVGRSRALEAALARAKAAADSDADVLIEAESGTGKELLARMIHDSSARRHAPFIAVNCAALPEALLGKRAVRSCARSLYGSARGQARQVRAGPWWNAAAGRDRRHAAGVAAQAAAGAAGASGRATGGKPVPSAPTFA